MSSVYKAYVSNIGVEMVQVWDVLSNEEVVNIISSAPSHATAA